MATSGLIRNDFRTGYAVQIAWNVISQNVANNTSSVRVRTQLVSTGSSYAISSSVTKNGSVVINGSTYSFTFSAALTGGQTKTVDDRTVTVGHNSDGSKTCSMSCTLGINVTLSGTYYGNVTASGAGTFNVIPRASTLDNLTNATSYLDGTFTYKYTPKSASFYNRLRVSIPNVVALQSVNLGQKATGQQTGTYNFTQALLENIYNRYPSAPTVIIGFVVETYSDSGYTSKVGESSELKLTLTIPLSVVPTISSVGITENVAGIAAKFGAFVQDKSKVDVAIIAAGVYGSTIASYKTTILGIDYLGASFTSGILGASGLATVVTTVTDTRGRTTTASSQINVLAYQSPTINAFSAFRCNADGTENYEGTRLKITFNFSIATVNNLNDKYYEIVYRVKGTASWSILQSATDVYTLDTNIISGAVFSVDNAYDLGINIYDFFGSDHAQVDIPTAFTLVDFRSTGKGIAFGKVSESDEMEVALDLKVTGSFIQDARQSATLLNSWVNYGSAFESATYFKDKCSVVHLAGLIKSGAVTDGTVIFTLPAGYRPRAPEKFFAVSVNAICVIDIYTNGNVTIRSGANAGWLSLSGISFIGG